MYTRAIYYFGFTAFSLPFTGVKIINRSYVMLYLKILPWQRKR